MFTVFTYQCDLIKWTVHNASVGYTVGHYFFQNHPLSRTSNVVNIDCVNQPTSIWSNVVYKLNLNSYPVIVTQPQIVVSNKAGIHALI